MTDSNPPLGVIRLGGGPAAPEGRLELTWTNKRLRLLAHDDGSYEWVNPVSSWVDPFVGAVVVGEQAETLVRPSQLQPNGSTQLITGLPRSGCFTTSRP